MKGARGEEKIWNERRARLLQEVVDGFFFIY
jgi:hypothetical protein